MENKIEAVKDQISKVRRNAPKLYPQISELGKIPPQAINVEEAVLGALMLERDALMEVLDILTPKIFYKEEHKIIYEAIVNLSVKSNPIDILTVTAELRKEAKLEEVGGAYYISDLTNRVGSSANIEYHARILVEKFILRELIRISSKIQEDAFNETTDVFDLLDSAEQNLFNIAQGNLKGDYETMSDLIVKSIQSIEEIKNTRDERGGVTGVPSGYNDLDRITSGWQKSDLIIIASRPGMGKTSLALSMARNAAVDFDMPIAVFSLEMSSLQLVQRLISAEAELDAMKLRNGDLEEHEWQQLNTKINRLSDSKIFIDDTPGINVFELRAKCRRLHSQEGIKMVLIDYLQLMNAQTDNRRNFNRENEISTISRALKGLAKELDIPVIALSQLSREVEKRTSSKRPILSDLRESGSIEQDADQVMFIYRPEYYGLTENEDGDPTTGLAELIIAKNRHGSVSTVKLKFISTFARFSNLDDYTITPTHDGMVIKNSKINDDSDSDENIENTNDDGIAPF
ncbi:MAG: replicative DNA helicase [Bacteroidota bacterium]|nr:replicative DNA helicase [Bacteroidota bacterium]